MAHLRHRREQRPATVQNEREKKLDVKQESDSPYEKAKRTNFVRNYLEPVLGPLLLTAVAFYLRSYHLAENKHVIWDEAHFAKFGAFYNRHEFYHDVHPPLGKMLCGLSEYLSGFKNSKFMFESGKSYPRDINIKQMRLFQVVFSTLVVPMCYYTCKQMQLSLWSTYLISLNACFEISFIVLGKFVLLDNFLIFFITASFMCFSRVFNLRKREGSRLWKVWMLLTGASIGCACSVKWVGLFVTAVIGLYVILDLWIKFWDTQHFTWKKYSRCWAYRIIYLIIVPIMMYLLFFKIHYALLYKPGTGSGSMSTLFQVNLRQTDIGDQPRLVKLDNTVTIRSQGPSPNLLHSHPQLYPDGSNQHQVTTYGYKDTNNVWTFRPAREDWSYTDYLKDGDVIRLKHTNTAANLHSHEIHGHVSPEFYEVSGYGDEAIGDEKDDWVFEVMDQIHSSNTTYANVNEQDPEYFDYIHPVSTSFRLRHKYLGCYLATTGKAYPAWGFKQGEVICKPAAPKDSFRARFDKSTWWNIESVEKSNVPLDHEYKYPKSSFLDDFLMTQRAMMASNNGLIPDDDKDDVISSSWWEWPLLRGGIRMSSWSSYERRYYMFDSPFVMWSTTAAVLVFVLIMLRLAILWQRQALFLDESTTSRLLITGVAPFLAWFIHYLPFIIMGRVTYFHHYTPALYFAVFVAAFVVDYLTHGFNKYLKASIYISLYSMLLYFFYLFGPTALGMTGRVDSYKYINWLHEWTMSEYAPFSIEAIWEHTRDDLIDTYKYVKSLVPLKA